MDDKGILGIENRTENWKSAIYFSQLFRGRRHLVAKRLGGESDLGPREVKLELSTAGVRVDAGELIIMTVSEVW